MLGQFLFFYFCIGAALVVYAFRGDPIRRAHLKIVTDKGRGYAVGLVVCTMLYLIVLWPYAVYDATRAR
jgi:hypothetical protein